MLEFIVKNSINLMFLDGIKKVNNLCLKKLTKLINKILFKREWKGILIIYYLREWFLFLVLNCEHKITLSKFYFATENKRSK